MQNYEVEVKALLGSEERAGEVRDAMRKIHATIKLASKSKQLNHYFEGGTLAKLSEVTSKYLSDSVQDKLQDFASKAKDFSVRTRQFDKLMAGEKGDAVLLVVKAAVDDTSSENGIARMEFEETVPLSLKQLDDLILSAGFKYQAKWSREREEYLCKGVNVTLDKNAGYGWLAEFERVVDDESALDRAYEDIRALMRELGVAELPQDRLGRMFSFYNEHWNEYYGTEKIFTIE